MGHDGYEVAQHADTEENQEDSYDHTDVCGSTSGSPLGQRITGVALTVAGEIGAWRAIHVRRRLVIPEPVVRSGSGHTPPLFFHGLLTYQMSERAEDLHKRIGVVSIEECLQEQGHRVVRPGGSEQP
jgi:hypothetical protein